MRSLLAHQGGWDELLVLLSPIPILVVLRLLERRRAGDEGGQDPDEPDLSPGESPTSRQDRG